MGGDGVYGQGPEGVPPPVGATDHGADGEMCGRRRVGVPLGSVENVNRRAPPHRGVHQEAVGNHSRKGLLPPHI